MPNRIIREGFLDSERVDRLDWFAECVYHRMLLAADDAGRLDGRSSVLKSRLFPLKKRLRESDIERAVHQIEQAGLLKQWTYQNRPVLQLTTWRKCSSSQTSRYPDPHGSFAIRFVRIETPQGLAELVDTSLVGEYTSAPVPTPCRPPSDPVPTGFATNTYTETYTNTTTTTNTGTKTPCVVVGVEDVRLEYERLAALWPRGWPSQERDRHLLARLLVAKAGGKPWAKAILDAFTEVAQAGPKPRNPGAYLQTLAVRLIPPDEQAWFNGLNVPDWAHQPPPRRNTACACAKPPPNGSPPRTPEEIAATRAVIQECLAVIQGRAVMPDSRSLPDAVPE